jgi:hypothetical protein
MTHYTYGNAYACQTLVVTSKPDNRTHQTKDCLRGEVTRLTSEINALRTANGALMERVKATEGGR